MALREEKVNWNDINYRKESSMAWLNAMNNAAILVAARTPAMGISYSEEEVLKRLESFRDKIYRLNMTKIDHDAAGNIDPDKLD